MSWDLIFQHLFIVLAASLLSIAVGLPLGIWAYVSKTARPVILRIVDLLQTIPSLALLGIIMVVLDPGKLTVITGITLYSLLPIVPGTSSPSTRTEKSPCETLSIALIRSFIGLSFERLRRTEIIIENMISITISITGNPKWLKRNPGMKPARNRIRYDPPVKMPDSTSTNSRYAISKAVSECLGSPFMRASPPYNPARAP